MVSVVKPVAVILGVGDGLSASVARLLHRQGYDLVLGARNIEKFQDLTTELQATSVVCDATQPQQVQGLFAACPRPPTVALYNPSLRVKGPIQEVDPQQMKRAMEITGYGSFLFGQEAAKVMLEPRVPFCLPVLRPVSRAFPNRPPLPWANLRNEDWPKVWPENCMYVCVCVCWILFVERSTIPHCPVQSFPSNSHAAVFGWHLFVFLCVRCFLFLGNDIYDLYGLAHIIVCDFCMGWLTTNNNNTLLQPQGIHVVWIAVDGGIGVGAAPWTPQLADSLLHPDEIAKTYWALIQQHRSTWTNEIEVRPWVEKF